MQAVENVWKNEQREKRKKERNIVRKKEVKKTRQNDQKKWKKEKDILKKCEIYFKREIALRCCTLQKHSVHGFQVNESTKDISIHLYMFSTWWMLADSSFLSQTFNSVELVVWNC